MPLTLHERHAMRKSQEHFVNNLKRTHEAFKQALNNVALASLVDDASRKTKSIGELLKALERIRDFIHESELPQWVQVLEGALKAAINDPSPSNLQNLGLKVAQIYDAAIKHVWVYDDEADSIDLSAEITKIQSESNVQALFDDLIEKLRDLILANNLDSSIAEKSLNSLIDLIRKNSRKSWTWPAIARIARLALKNFVELYSKRENANPECAAAIEAVMKAYTQVQAEIDSTNEKVSIQLSSLVQSKFR